MVFPRLWKARKQGACPCQNRRQISPIGLGNRVLHDTTYRFDEAALEINREQNMNITSRQKKIVLPFAVFIISAATYIKMLGSLLVLLVVPFMCISLGALIVNLWPSVSGWFNRDGWK